MLVLGPGLVTGASDDDPSGIATYSQVGAQFGYGMLWTMVVSYPLMTGIQEVSARIGRVMLMEAPEKNRCNSSEAAQGPIFSGPVGGGNTAKSRPFSHISRPMQ